MHSTDRRTGKLSASQWAAMLLPTVITVALLGLSWQQGDLLWIGRITGRSPANVNSNQATEHTETVYVTPPENRTPTPPAQPESASDKNPKPQPKIVDASIDPAAEAALKQRERERKAVGKLKLALQFFDRERAETGRRWLRDLQAEFPDTVAAQKAAEFLAGTVELDALRQLVAADE